MQSRTRIALLNFFNIYPEEQQQLAISLAYAFLTGACQCFLAILPMALFLCQYNASLLPIAYFGVSVTILLTGFLYSRVESRLRFEKLIPLLLGFLIIPLIVCSLLSVYFNLNIAIFMLLVWSLAVWFLSDLELWGILNRLFTLQQAKRLFGLVGTSQAAGTIVGGLGAPLLVQVIDVSSGLFLAPLLLFSTYMILRTMIKWFPERLVKRGYEMAEGAANRQISMKKALSSGYFRKLFLMISLGIFLFYILDLAFNTAASQYYTTPESLASFFGIIFAVANLLAAVVQAVILRILLEKRGLFFCLLMPPLIVGSIVAMAIGSYLVSMMLMFFFIALAKVMDEAIRGAMSDTSMLLLYQPLHSDLRLWAQAKAETIITAIATSIVSIILYLIVWGLSDSVIWLLILYVAFVLLSFIVITSTKKDYIAELSKSISRRSVSEHIHVADKLVVDLYKQHCRSRHPMEVILCMQKLGDLSPAYLDDVLPEMLDHSSTEVSAAAVATIAKYRFIKYQIKLERMLHEVTRPEMLAEVIIALCALQTGKDLSWCLPYLSDKHELVRDAAVRGLIKYGRPPYSEQAKQVLSEMVHSQNTQTLLSAARLIAKMEDPVFQESLRPLLNHDDPEVRKKAIEAIGLIRANVYHELLVKSLNDPALKNTAGKSIVRLNELILPYLAENFARYPDYTQITIAQLLGMMSKKGAIAILLINVNTNNDHVMMAILASLDKHLYTPVKEHEVTLLEDKLKGDLEKIEFLLTIYQQLPFRQAATDPLKEIIYSHIQTIWKRVFFALGCRYSHEIIYKITTAIMTENDDQRSYAQELLQVTLSKLHSQSILPLLMTTLYKMNQEAVQKKGEQGLIDMLRGMLNYPASSFLLIKMATIYTIVQMQLGEFIEELRPLTNDENPLMRETAVWALEKFNRHLP